MLRDKLKEKEIEEEREKRAYRELLDEYKKHAKDYIDQMKRPDDLERKVNPYSEPVTNLK